MAENDKTAEFDPGVIWFPHRVVNHRAMAQAWAAWEYERKHEKAPYHDGTFSSWSADRSDAHPHHMWDGTHYVMTQDKPDSDDWF